MNRKKKMKAEEERRGSKKPIIQFKLLNPSERAPNKMLHCLILGQLRDITEQSFIRREGFPGNLRGNLRGANCSMFQPRNTNRQSGIQYSVTTNYLPHRNSTK